jgi:hypothetical protein
MRRKSARPSAAEMIDPDGHIRIRPLITPRRNVLLALITAALLALAGVGPATAVTGPADSRSNTSTTASPTPRRSDGTLIDSAAAAAKKLATYWTPERIKKARPADGVNTSASSPGSATCPAGPPRLSAGRTDASRKRVRYALSACRPRAAGGPASPRSAAWHEPPIHCCEALTLTMRGVRIARPTLRGLRCPNLFPTADGFYTVAPPGAMAVSRG